MWAPNGNICWRCILARRAQRLELTRGQDARRVSTFDGIVVGPVPQHRSLSVSKHLAASQELSSLMHVMGGFALSTPDGAMVLCGHSYGQLVAERFALALAACAPALFTLFGIDGRCTKPFRMDKFDPVLIRDAPGV